MLRLVSTLLTLQATLAFNPGDNAPQFAAQYFASGVLRLPYAELREPFSAWVDLTNDLSRLDYYNGVTKTYQLGNKLGGSIFKLMPVTADGTSKYNTQTCYLTHGSGNSPVHAMSVLPDAAGYKFVKREVLYGTECDKFQLQNDHGQKHDQYSLWTTTVNGTHRPVLFEMKGYDSLLGSHFDHYLVEYLEFKASPPSSSDLSPPDVRTCSGWMPGYPGETVYAMNPFSEFFAPNDGHVHEAFDHFRRRHDKNYDNERHLAEAHNNFRHNLRLIHSKNRDNLTYTLSLNHLADKSPEQLRVLRGFRFFKGDRGSLKFPYTPDQINQCHDCPNTLDWRIRGAVTPVKDQAVCGSCWSFGTTGAVESGHFVAAGGKKALRRLSQQALVDCSWGQGNNGCDGGEDVSAYKWIKLHGLPTEADYGDYLGADSFCHANQSEEHAVHIAGHVDVPSGHERAAQWALFKHGPLSVAIDASHLSFAFYANGVYYEPKCGNGPNQLDHAVLAVGYGSLDGEPYWLVKNSWSTYWGNDGYVLMSRRDNNCGVTTSATYVTFH